MITKNAGKLWWMIILLSWKWVSTVSIQNVMSGQIVDSIWVSIITSIQNGYSCMIICRLDMSLLYIE